MDATIFTISTNSNEKYDWIFHLHYTLSLGDGSSQKLTMKPKPVGSAKCCKRYTMFTFEMEVEEAKMDVEGSGSENCHQNVTQNEEIFDLVGVVTPAYVTYLN